MKRNSVVYGLLILLTIALGLCSRSGIVPKLIYPYLGDYLYACLWYLIIAYLFASETPRKVVLISLLICFLIECSQFYQADWINNIRSYKIGGLILGYGFLWSDLLSYTLGVLTAYGLESKYMR